MIDCDTANYVCTGGWMYEAYEYVRNNGILLRKDYGAYIAS